MAGALAAAVLAAGYGGWALWQQVLRQPGPLAQARDLVVPHGSTGQLAEVLRGDEVITRPLVFRLAVWASRMQGPVHAGEFAFPAHASVGQVLAILRGGRPVEHHLTIPEGLTAQQIVALVEHADAAAGPAPPISEGAVLPQTYDYEYGTERAAIVARARAAMDKTLAMAWDDRAADLPLQSSRDAVILASIVERETAKPEERPHVAAVYLNRLRQGMKLQADPTVAYGANGGAGGLDRPLTRADLEQATPFNTYRNAGLPPSPICAPGRLSLQAVLHPAASEDLFFVADGSGGHVFSLTFHDHNAAVAHWRSQTAPRGGAEPGQPR